MSECLGAHGCITCGDEAVAMRVLQIDTERGLALCADAADRHSSVEIALVEPVACGESLLVHAGTALGRAARCESTAELREPAGRASA
jgi:hydrogenase maturation factor